MAAIGRRYGECGRGARGVGDAAPYGGYGWGQRGGERCSPLRRVRGVRTANDRPYDLSPPDP